MENTTFEIIDFLLNQARNVRGTHVYDDYETYLSTPENERKNLPQNICKHYTDVMRTMEKMASYGNNHWWIMLKSSEVQKTHQSVSLRSKARIYFQVFDCGIETMLISDAQLVNDINDLIILTGKAITSWIIKNPTLFQSYVIYLQKHLDSDKEFQRYLKELEAL